MIVNGFRAALDLDTCNLIRPRCAERAKPGRGKPVLIMHIGFFACFHAISLERSHFSKIGTLFFCPCSTEAVGIAHKPPRSLYSAKIVADKLTNRQTDTQTNYCNPCCTCALRVNNAHIMMHAYTVKPHRTSVRCKFSLAIIIIIVVLSILHQRFTINTRQRQLAELTPSKLIELAYLSALLEQYPFSTTEPISEKVEVIRTFLKKVVHVVPFESIAYAIAYGPDKVAVYCAKALIASTIELPASLLMEQGLYSAFIHLTSGTVSAIALTRKACTKLKSYLPADELLQFQLGRTSTQAVLQVTSTKYDVSVTESIESCGLPASELLGKEDLYKFKVLQRDNRLKAEQSNIIGKASIEHLYCVSTPSTDHQKQDSFQSPLDVLREGNAKLTALAKGLMAAAKKSKSTKKNAQMLQAVNEIRDVDLAICTALLGGFMEQQEIDIPLMKSRLDQSRAFAVRGPASMGVWALSSLKYEDIHPILSKCRGNQLLVKIESYIQEVLNREGMIESTDDQYAAKLQFIVQSLEKTVTCNSQYVSYSLERQLIAICKERKIDSETSLDDLEKKWGVLFRDNILSLVARSHRPLIARWMKWALMVHDLREKLAEYTAVGVVGLVNSGKSMLVSTLFKIPVSYYLPVLCLYYKSGVAQVLCMVFPPVNRYQ